MTLVGLSRPGLRNRNVLLKNELEGLAGSPDEDPEGEGGTKAGDGIVERVWKGVLYCKLYGSFESVLIVGPW